MRKPETAGAHLILQNGGINLRGKFKTKHGLGKKNLEKRGNGTGESLLDCQVGGTGRGGRAKEQEPGKKKIWKPGGKRCTKGRAQSGKKRNKSQASNSQAS